MYRTALPETGIGAEAIQGLVDVARQSRAQNGRFFGYVLGSGETSRGGDRFIVQRTESERHRLAIGSRRHDDRADGGGLVGAGHRLREFSGILTGGGSSANLMALAMAREAKIPANERGIRAGVAAAFYASSEVHMSIPKAIALLGIGRENLRRIPVDEAFRILPEQLEQAMREDKRNGVTPIAVVATAGTVNTGAIDPLPQVAAIAASYGAWFMLMELMARWEPWLLQKSFKACRWPTRFPLIRTSGCTNRLIAVVCYFGSPARPKCLFGKRRLRACAHERSGGGLCGL